MKSSGWYQGQDPRDAFCHSAESKQLRVWLRSGNHLTPRTQAEVYQQPVCGLINLVEPALVTISGESSSVPLSSFQALPVTSSSWHLSYHSHSENPAHWVAKIEATVLLSECATVGLGSLSVPLSCWLVVQSKSLSPCCSENDILIRFSKTYGLVPSLSILQVHQILTTFDYKLQEYIYIDHGFERAFLTQISLSS